jgi:hypothetical protein
MNTARVVGMLYSAILLGVPAAASAARPATAEEKAAVSAVYTTSPDCSEVIVSERNPEYARWDFVPSDTCQALGNGFGIARRDTSGQWRDFYQASGQRRRVSANPSADGGRGGAAGLPKAEQAHLHHELPERPGALQAASATPRGTLVSRRVALARLGSPSRQGQRRLGLFRPIRDLQSPDPSASLPRAILRGTADLRSADPNVVRRADHDRYAHFEGPLRMRCPAPR